MIFMVEDSVEMQFSEEEAFQLIDPSYTAEPVPEPFTLSIVTRGLLCGERGTGSAVFTRHVAVISSKFEYLLQNIDTGIALDFRRTGTVVGAWAIDCTHLKLSKGATELFSVPFNEIPLMDDEAHSRPPTLDIEQAEVLGADLSQVIAFSRIVPGAPERKLRGQVLEAAMGL